MAGSVTDASQGAARTKEAVRALRDPQDVALLTRLRDRHDQMRGIDLGCTVTVINTARSDLAGTPAGAMPELLERLVVQRLVTP